MSIFEPSTPADFSPELDTENVAAEEEIHEEEVIEKESFEQEEEQTEEEPDSHEEQSDQLLAGKFKTQDDLVKAYKNLERSFHESRQKPQQQPQYQEQPVDPYYQEDPNDIVLRAVQEDPVGTLRYFTEQAQAEERRTAQYNNTLTEIATTYKASIKSEDDLRTLNEKYWEIAGELGVRDGKSPRIAKLAAEELWGKQSLTQVYKQAEQAGAQRAEQARKAKLGLNAPGNSKPKETPKTPEDLIADSIVSAGSRKGIFG